MKKLISVALPILLFSCYAFSQAFDDGTNLVSLGFGIPPGQRLEDEFDKNNTSYIDYKLKNYGTAVLKFEHGLSKYFGLGLNTEYSGAAVSYKYDQNSSLRYERLKKVNIFGFYARINAHFPVTDKFDLYGGVGLGYLYSINKITDTNPNTSQDSQQVRKILDFDYQITIGARFMIKDNIGLFVELGRATTPAQIGVVFKF